MKKLSIYSPIDPHLVISLLIVPLTLFCFMLLPILLGLWKGYLLSFGVYWFFCLLHGSKLKVGSMKALYRLPSFNNRSAITYLLCFMPALGAFIVSFLPAVKHFSPLLLVLVMLASLINGFVEEYYWRATFLSRYRQQIRRAYLIPAGLFGLWHISVWAAPGMLYQGGFAALVGGACFMGLLWGYVAYRHQQVLMVTIAHILTNFFAFTGLVADNFFLL